jgi:uncharacterized protein YodC (DUF2158 family)
MDSPVKLKKGDVVVLKSGGPKMTVQNFGEQKPGILTNVNWVHCIWFEGNTVYEYNFDQIVLKLASRKNQPEN